MAHELKLSADVTRPAHKRHGRASELLAGAVNKQNWPDPVPLYVCDRCLKYFFEVVVWEVHQVSLLLHTDDCHPNRRISGIANGSTLLGGRSTTVTPFVYGKSTVP